MKSPCVQGNMVINLGDNAWHNEKSEFIRTHNITSKNHVWSGIVGKQNCVTCIAQSIIGDILVLKKHN